MPEANAKRHQAEGTGSGPAVPPVNASVGQLLRAERERRGWQTVDIAKHLKIRRALLDAIETGRHHDLPPLAKYLDVLTRLSDHSVRKKLLSFAHDHGIPV